MTIPVHCSNNIYHPREDITPDNRVVAILQDKKDGTIIEKSLNLEHLGRLVTEIRKIRKNTPNRYVLIGVHSFTVDQGSD